MWTRQELKSRAKGGLKRNYWKVVFLSLLITLIFVGTAANVRSGMEDGTVNDAMAEASSGQVATAATGLLAGISIGGGVISALFRAVCDNPLKVGIANYCLNAVDGNAPLQDINVGFKPKYLANVWALLLRDIVVSLWGVLLVVPGIVMGLAYSQVEYIMAENPGMSPKEAMAKSRAMMQGYKWKLFVLDLSFLGWDILSAFTFGILNVFYVAPYKMLTKAALYQEIKKSV